MEANNMKAMREALIRARNAMVAVVESVGGEENKEVLKAIDAALAKPPRQCDVGSVKEQKERFKEFCKKGKLGRIDLGAYCAYDCPCRNSYDCKLEWAQMPYRERR